MAFSIGTKRTTSSQYKDKVYKCMNCGTTIDSPEGNMYTKRFCSDKCMQEYMKGR